LTRLPAITAGRSYPLGATPDADGVNFAVFSDNATRIQVCLFDDAGAETRCDLPERAGGIWHGHIAGIGAGQPYGLRADGPFEPAAGHRFNPSKLLLDPYARRITGQPIWDPALFDVDAANPTDTAPFMPRCVVQGLLPDAPTRPATPMDQTMIYEAHLKGLTARMPGIANPGTWAALGDPLVTDHLTNLGITALELLPVQAFINDRFLVDLGLTNYWGYQTVGFFAPDPRYLSDGDIGEVQTAIARLHDAGVEVILDVVYNHSGEGDHLGPTLCFRGLDNASYYRLEDDRSRYVNDTGTGNTLDLTHPMVLRMVMDSLRYWVGVMGVDGFRFDLAATLARRADGFDPRAPLLDSIRQDPLLADVKLIAEPWDIGPGGYQLGAFPSPFAEWNDKFRDTTRRFWRGDAYQVADMAGVLMGSAQQFDHSGRAATSSVNLITAHDGFTLADTVSYARRHNEANGEAGRDGHGENFSDNLGHEGPTDTPAILAARAQRQRNMLATLMIAQGTPMLLGGDEIGRTQSGNNNGYNQDNEITWLDWAAADTEVLNFTRRLIALRRDTPVLRQRRFLHGDTRTDGRPDLVWRRADGRVMTGADWTDPTRRKLMAELRMAADTPGPLDASAVLLILNAGAAVTVTVPPGRWQRSLDTADPLASPDTVHTAKLDVAAASLMLLTSQPEET
jgi:isoamylase